MSEPERGEPVDEIEDASQSSGPPASLEPLSQEDERTYAMAAHVSCLFASILGPVVVQMINKQRSGFVDQHAKEAINFQINLIVLLMASFMLSIIGIGICGFFLLMPLAIVMPVLAGLEANKGNVYRYPLIIRVVQ